VKQTAITHLHRTERETVTDCPFVAHQHTPSYCCPYNDHTSKKIPDNPPYSSDLMTSDFYLAGLIKKAVRSCRFADHGTMKDAGYYWPHTQLKTLYSDAFKMVVDCWTKCFEKQEDHAER